jgi:SAM-dependent methyltransferase
VAPPERNVSEPERPVQVPPEHYWSRAYNSKERICSFWHQVDEVLGLGGGRVLEVGPGNGLVTEWLRRAGCDVVTLDHDPQLQPDVVGSVTAVPLPDDDVDVALAGQVLEHLPWDDARAALGEMARVARVGVVVSLPDASPFAGVASPLYHGFYIENVRRQRAPTRMGLLGQLLRRELRVRDVLWTRVVPATWALGGRTFQLPTWLIPHRPWKQEFDGEHYYEIGTLDFPVERVLRAFADSGLDVERRFRVPENPWHHFFVARTR